jgi:alkanesulfonate monooxygenase SsuD/methylene tetrahydromethanopterin reductase-like flavin-dependent oxidoreductase (luciferase family)
MIGGSGERKTLRLVAQYGDACNLFASSPEEVEHKLNVLRRHCDDVGRDYAEIRKTVMANNPRHTPETRDAFVAQMADYAKLGVQTAITMTTSGSPAAWIDGMAPAFQQLVGLG